MATRKRFWVAGLATIGMVSAGYALGHNKGGSVAGLGKHESVRISFPSKGCFHNESFVLKLSGNDPNKLHIQGPDLKTAISFSDESRQDLEKTVGFYRSNPGSGCTTVDYVTVYWMKFGIPYSRENFEDSTCSQGLISGLIRKAKPELSIGPGAILR